MTDSPPPAAPTAPLDAGRDPVTGLRRMSKTAGVGMSDYAAISTLAVVALVLGLASPLVFFTVYLVLVPIAGVVVAAVAARKIATSNGTETGLPLALVGGLLSAGFLGWYAYSTVADGRRADADRARVAAVVEQFGADLKQDDFDAAYALFDARFQQQVDRDRFESVLKARQANPYYGQIQGVTLAGDGRFEDDPETSARVGQVFLRLALPPVAAPGATSRPAGDAPRYDTQAAVFREEDGQWRLLNIPEVFAPPQGQQ